MNCPVQQLPALLTAKSYANGVLSGSIVAGKRLQATCRRFLDDIEHCKERGIYFDEKAAQHVVDFFGFLRHTKGVWAKKPHTSGFLLAPWQVFILANLFGFKIFGSGKRRFREAYIEIARKNGKSTFVAGIGLYMLISDGEPGAEIYSAATTKDQAKIVFEAAQNMVKRSPFLAEQVGFYRNNLHIENSLSKFEPLASDSKTLDGLNVHCALIDELYEHPTRDLYEVLNTATVARSQPLLLEITTVGFKQLGICWEQRKYGIELLPLISADGQWFAPIKTDDNFFVFVACMDEKTEAYGGDDWKDEKNWPKANPNLGVSVSLEAIRPIAIKAIEQPHALNEFLRKHLDVWTSSETSWLAVGAWEKNCAVGTEHQDVKKLREEAYEKLKGRRCYGGLDAASEDDITAFVLVFPPCDRIVATVEVTETQDEADVRWINRRGPRPVPRKHKAEKVIQEADNKWCILPWFWLPKDLMEARAKLNRQSYESWIRGGLITTTPGNKVDQLAIREIVLKCHRDFRVGEVGYDHWGCEFLGPQLLADGIKMTKIPQNGMEYMSGPTKNLSNFINTGSMEHYCNPVLRWMASNVTIYTDPNGNYKPMKGKSRDKIDGIIALVMAIGRALVNPNDSKKDDPNRYAVRTI